jgi:hypothetical protein
MSQRVADVTVYVKLKPPPAETELRAVLAQIEVDPGANPYLNIASSPNTHLVNFAITDDADNGKRLVFAAVFDGKLDGYLDELLALAPGLDDIFSKCEGWSGRENFAAFVAANRLIPDAEFAGFPYESRANIKLMSELRNAVQYFLDLPDVARFLESPGIQSLFDTISQLQPGTTSLMMKTSKLETVLGRLHDAFFWLVIEGAKFYGTLIVDDNFKSAGSNLDQRIDTSLSDGDNMTNLIEVRPELLWRLYLGLWVMNWLGRHAWEPGSLAGVTTIHFARWIMVDRGKRMLFQAQFDGSWENYMGDFVDKVSWGLDAIWGNCVGYPSAGMRDIDAFKRFIRDRQFAPSVNYFAYPDETVLTIMRDRAISSAFQNFLSVPLTKALLEML